MRTSEEIYHRVRWDPRFDPSRFVFGVEQRAAAVKRVPLPGFVPGGEIPWHRVLFVEAEGEVVWDRATGLDRIDESGLGRAQVPRLLRAPHFVAGTPHAWDPGVGRWQPFVAEFVGRAGWSGRSARADHGAGPRDHVRILTWNTLWDKYDGDRIQTSRRRPLLLAVLERADADVIALQEVEPQLLAMILASAWVRADYTVNTDPRGKEVDRGGLLLLSRLPMREAGSTVLGQRKGVAAITVDTDSGPLVVVATHLSSDHTDNGADRRREQLAVIGEGLASVDGDLVLVGDFNDRSEDSDAGPAAALGMLDAWTAVHGPFDHTPTFDPLRNPLAAVSSLSGRAARLDRVLVRRGGLRPVAAVVYGDVPAEDGLFASDHFGVLADLEVKPAASTAGDAGTANVLDVPPTARTALAWIPPEELWPAIQSIRAEYDPQASQWPPHVNILFGFVPESEFERAAPLVESALAQITAFATRLDGVHTFGHRDEATLWLDPAVGTENQWADLRHALERCFPRCRGRAEGFTPHLTLGRTRNPQRTALQVAARLSAMTAEVGELVLLSRRGDEPMRPRAMVTLGTGNRLRLLPETDDAFSPAAPTTKAGTEMGWLTPDPRRDALAARTAENLARALPNAVVYTVGSRRMDCALPGADLDLVAALGGDAADLADLASLVRGCLPKATRLRQVVGARVPGLKFTVSDLDVDLSIVATGQIPPAEAVARRAELGEAAATTLSAVSDADAIRAAAYSGSTSQEGATESGHAMFAYLARGVKAWAKARGLDSAPFGGLPGVAWSVLAARVVTDAAASQQLLQRFFATWAAWDWREPVFIGAPAPTDAPESQASVTVLTPAYPVRNCAVHVGPAGRDLLAAELYRAWGITEAATESGADPWAELLEPPPLHRRHAAWAVLTVRADQPSAFDRTQGKVRGRMLALLAALDEAGIPDAHAWPRPFESSPTNSRYAIGLGRTPPDKTALAAIASRWTTGLSGVTIDVVDCAAVPTLR
ncbi:MAG TPA: poly(A) polymerase [Actinocrinis sp.]|nr:poly(A) polymerase [Actinocrinis sp.]